MLVRTIIGKYVRNLGVYCYVPLSKIKRKDALEDTDEFIIEQYEDDEDIILNKKGEDVTNSLYDNKILSNTRVVSNFHDFSW